MMGIITMHVHSLKHNAKAAAKRIAARFSGLEVVEPVKAMPLPGAATDGWYASLKVAEGVLPSSIAPEVLELAHLELPEGWVVADGGFVSRVETPAENPYLEEDRIADRFADLNPDALVYESTGTEVRAVQYADGDEVVEPFDAALDALLAAVKPDSKEAQVFAMLRRPEGATVAEIAQAMTWEPHTTRAYISVRVRKRGVASLTEQVEGRGRVYRVGLLPAGETQAA